MAIVCALTAAAVLVRTPEDAERVARALERLLGPLVWTAAAAVLAIGVLFGAQAAGGSDPYGYVSQAHLWLTGNLHVPSPLAATVRWPDADWTFTPLGYRPAAGHTLVPTYPPGLPLVMALFQLLLGDRGPFLVAPLCGALLVLVADRLGTAVGGRVVGAMAALCTASSPAVLFMTVWPMSDVPAATCFAAALWLACRRGAAASGLAAGLGIAIRPNLAPLALFPLAIMLWRNDRQEAAARIQRAVAFVLACGLLTLVPVWTNDTLYGSPLASGYGNADSLFGWHYMWANLAHYPAWLVETQSAAVLVFPFAVLAARRCALLETRVVGILLTYVAAVLALYTWYLPFTAWWFLRFLLPAFPVMFVCCALVIWQAGARFQPGTRAALAAGFTCWMALYGADASRRRGVFTVGASEQKYADVGRYVAGALPGDAVIVAMQHSGSIRLYSGRQILRYDFLAPDWLDKTLEQLASLHRPVYVVLEDWEIPVFRSRFVSQRSVAIVARPALAVDPTGVVRLYGVSPAPDEPAVPPAVMPATSGYALH